MVGIISETAIFVRTLQRSFISKPFEKIGFGELKTTDNLVIAASVGAGIILSGMGDLDQILCSTPCPLNCVSACPSGLILLYGTRDHIYHIALKFKISFEEILKL